jgi:hypothetical protein
MVGAAVYQESASTRVASGENAGKTLVEHRPVRAFAHERLKLDRGKPRHVSIPLTLPDGADPSAYGVAVFVQDWNNGHVYQADALPWPGPDAPAAR